MYIVIVGDGKVGHALAAHLVAEKHDVAIVERSELVQRRNQDMLDAMYIKGNGVSVETLREADIQRADIAIAVTVSDEVNMLVCLTAKRLGAQYTIARIRDPEYNRSQRFLMEELLIDYVLNPERTIASIKRNIGTRDGTTIDGKQRRPGRNPRAEGRPFPQHFLDLTVGGDCHADREQQVGDAEHRLLADLVVAWPILVDQSVSASFNTVERRARCGAVQLLVEECGPVERRDFRQGADHVFERIGVGGRNSILHAEEGAGEVVERPASALKELVITDSIQPTQAVLDAHNIRVVSIADLIGEAISRTAAEESVSSLFD